MNLKRKRMGLTVIVIGLIPLLLGSNEIKRDIVDVGVEAPNCLDMTVRPNSPCITTVAVCLKLNGTCPGVGQQVQFGNFQCDLPKQGTTCTGSSTFVPCYLQGNCQNDPNDITKCRINPQQAQWFAGETKIELDCN